MTLTILLSQESEEEVPGGDKLARVLADNQRLLRDSQAPSVSFSTPGINKRSNEDDEDMGAEQENNSEHESSNIITVRPYFKRSQNNSNDKLDGGR